MDGQLKYSVAWPGFQTIAVKETAKDYIKQYRKIESH
jgi:hypothetical protein